MHPERDFAKKLYYKINEVAKIVGVEDYVLRYWETRFPMLKPEKQRGDQRRYRQKDIELLLQIQSLVHEQNMPINDAVEELKREWRSSSSTQVRRISTTSPTSLPVQARLQDSRSIAANGHALNGSANNIVRQNTPLPISPKSLPRAEFTVLLQELEQMKKEYQSS